MFPVMKVLSIFCRCISHTKVKSLFLRFPQWPLITLVLETPSLWEDKTISSFLSVCQMSSSERRYVCKENMCTCTVFMAPKLICCWSLSHFNKEKLLKSWMPSQVFQKKPLYVVIRCKANLYKMTHLVQWGIFWVDLFNFGCGCSETWPILWS